MICKKCKIDKEQYLFYERHRVCRLCHSIKKKNEYVSVAKPKKPKKAKVSTRKQRIITGEYRLCIYCDEMLDTSKFYGIKTKCIICNKEDEYFRISKIDAFFEEGYKKRMAEFMKEVLKDLKIFKRR